MARVSARSESGSHDVDFVTGPELAIDGVVFSGLAEQLNNGGAGSE
jgi:hypothetical protein